MRIITVKVADVKRIIACTPPINGDLPYEPPDRNGPGLLGRSYERYAECPTVFYGA